MRVIDCQGRLKQSDFSSVDYMPKNPPTSNYRVKNGNWQLYDLDMEGWRTVFVMGIAGGAHLVMGDLDMSAADELTSCT